jgi:hypothetical protein
VQTLNAGLYKVRLVASYDSACVDLYGHNLSLELERPFPLGSLNQSKTLLFVQPAREADLELIDQGLSLKVIIPTLGTRQEVVRTFPIDWNSPANQNTERIVVEPAYLYDGSLLEH